MTDTGRLLMPDGGEVLGSRPVGLTAGPVQSPIRARREFTQEDKPTVTVTPMPASDVASSASRFQQLISAVTSILSTGRSKRSKGRVHLHSTDHIYSAPGMDHRLRQVTEDPFVSDLAGHVKKLRSRQSTLDEVTVDTQKEHEVAEALFSLANVKVDSSIQLDPSRSCNPKRRSQRGRKQALCRRKARKPVYDEGSISSGSFERLPRTRNRSRSGRMTTELSRTVLKENGRRACNPRPKSPVRKHVIHQQPARSRRQSSRIEASGRERVMLDGHLGRETDRSTVPEDKYYSVAVMDALKGVYGRGLICTSNEPPPATSSIQLKCEERSNESEADCPSMPQGNNSRHVHAARLIQSMVDKQKEEDLEPMELNQRRTEDIMKMLPLASGKLSSEMGSLYPSLPMPSTFSHFSMSRPSLPQSLIHTFHNSQLAALPTRLPPFSEHPPPLVRPSEPWKSHQ